MHIDYLNLQSNQENIKLYLNDRTKNGDSTFTLLIGENGVHKTTLLTYIYKIFSGKSINRDVKMKIGEDLLGIVNSKFSLFCL